LTSADLILEILRRLKKFRFLILLIGLGLGALLFWYAKRTPTIYTSKATVFPLTNSSDNSGVNSTLNNILGISEAPKSFSSEASINIIELATSRNTRESVALMRLAEFDNKTIAELLILANKNKKWNEGKPSDKIPTDTAKLANIGGTILKTGITAKINKNGVLELTFSSSQQEIISPISYAIVKKISDFYRELKVSKAKLDYEFTLKKVDSLDKELAKIDKQAIQMFNSTYFTPTDRLEFNIPKENLSALKDRTMRQRDVAANNREEAMWRLQKQTPIIQILDRPDPPYDKKESSPILFAIIGIVLGLILGCIVFVGGLVLKYAENELQKAIFKIKQNSEAKSAEAAAQAQTPPPVQANAS
jgi:uncharacterized protein involved in exopolysaccharide biosynthesis